MSCKVMQNLKTRPGLNRGFTLVEMLVSLFLFTIIIGTVFSYFAAVNSLELLNVSLIDLQQQARGVIDGMSREIRHSRVANISITHAGAGIDFAIGGDAISYYLNNNSQVIREYPVGTDRIIANKITFLNFNPDVTNQTVQIAVTATTTNAQNRTLTFGMSEKVRLRN
jgi:prepilin-type N-terminal cleavage/methylation domain-containing protein